MKKVTMQQIADQLGVSKYAVSQALSGKPGVGEETRNRIIQAATAQGYYNQRHTRHKVRPTHAASIERKSSSAFTNTVIVLMPNVRFQYRGSLFWGRIADGVIAGLEERGIGSMIVTEHNSERFLSIINPDRVMGLIGIGFISNQLVLEIRNAGIPFVLIDHEDSLVMTDTVFMNNFDSMRRLTSHLGFLGHTNMRFVGHPHYSRSFFDRWLGFRSALEEMGLPVPDAKDRFLTIEDNAYEVLPEALKSLQAKKSMPTAFVCANDFNALVLIEYLTALGLRVPEDVSVTGFDNMEEGSVHTPALSTINVPKETMGKKAVELLMLKIQDPDKTCEKTMIHGDFINRQSIAPVTNGEEKTEVITHG